MAAHAAPSGLRFGRHESGLWRFRKAWRRIELGAAERLEAELLEGVDVTRPEIAVEALNRGGDDLQSRRRSLPFDEPPHRRRLHHVLQGGERRGARLVAVGTNGAGR